REVELGAVEIRQALGIDDHRDAVAVEAVIVGSDLVGILELVRKTRAAARADAHAQADSLPTLGQGTCDMLGRVRGKRDGRRADFSAGAVTGCAAGSLAFSPSPCFFR